MTRVLNGAIAAPRGIEGGATRETPRLTPVSLAAPLLEALYARFDIRFLSPDPLAALAPWRARRADLEVAALIGSALAYGRADMIERVVGAVLSEMRPTPARFARRLASSPDRSWLRRFRYRFNNGADIRALVRAIGRALEEHGSLEALFLAGDLDKAGSTLDGLDRFTRALKKFARRSAPSFQYLLPSPSNRSATKRLNLFMRWMSRRDKIDPGPWRDSVDPARLIIPLDVHVGRIARRLGLLTRATDDRQAAEELTRYLSKIDPTDPVRFDFALCSYGKLGYCLKTSRLDLCARCELEAICAK